MKRLIFLRHGKAESLASQGDRARKLTPSGIEECGHLAKKLATTRGYEPNVILCSDAARAVQTWQNIAKLWAGDAPVTIRKDFLDMSLEDLRETIIQQNDECGTLLLVGHNPVWTEIASQLTGNMVPLGTANAALLFCDSSSWGSAMEKHWSLSHHLSPH